MKIAFFGLPLGALLLLDDGHPLSLAVLSPLEAPGRRRLRHLLGQERVVVSEGEARESIPRRLAAAAPDLIVSWFFTQRIEQRWLDLAQHGGIGAHPSLLPRHRGPNPFFWTIDQGDPHTGVTVHRLENAYDTGAVLATQALSVDNSDAWQLARALDRPSLGLLRQTVARLAHGEVVAETPQDESLATWAPEPSGELLRADFHWPSERILRRIRALSPVPGLALEIRGLRFFVTRASPHTGALPMLDPGEAAIVSKGGQRQLLLRTGDGALVIERAVLGSNEGPWPQREGELCHGAQLTEALLLRSPELAGSVIGAIDQ